MISTTEDGPIEAGKREERDRGARILIVDDRPDKLLTLDAALTPLGREVVTVGSGEDALRQLLHDEFAVVLLDVNMPGMDGFETARLIRQRPRNRQTPIIFVTAYGDDIHSLQGYSLGAVDFMLSPVTPEILCSKVSVFLALHERTSEVRRQALRLERHTRQLEALTSASLAIHAADSIDEALQTAVDAARRIVDGKRAWALLRVEQAGFRNERFASSPALSTTEGASTSMGGHPESPETQAVCQDEASISDDVTSAALCDRDGNPMGMLFVSHGVDRPPGISDESLLTQLAQMTATAIENILFAEAREANRIKDEFLATLSHELRTPLSAILGWSQLLRSQNLTAEEMSEALEIIERNGQMQHKLIEDLLDISRIVTGKMQLSLKPIDLAGVIQAAVDVTLPSAQARQIDIHVELDADRLRVSGDADRLQQVLWNLLSNAVKFTPPGGKIEVRLQSAPGQAQISVHDTGEGISPEFLPYIFDRFRQADSSASRRHGGLGIGLAIVRHVVELHGGSVHAESPGKGCGTRITISLPRGTPEAELPLASSTALPTASASSLETAELASRH